MERRFFAPPTRWKALDGRYRITGLREGSVLYSPEVLASLKRDYEAERKGLQGRFKSWEVPSESRQWKKYTVRLIDGEWDCTCSGFAYRGTCSHVEFAEILHEEEEWNLECLREYEEKGDDS